MDSWLKAYLKYTEKHEAPELFHFWIGITLLSSAMGRKIWFDRGYYKLFSNFFVIIVAGSARCRKSTAIGIGSNILRDAEVARIVSGKTSPERFIHEIQSTEEVPPPLLVVEDELSTFLTRDHHGDKLIDILTKLFDCPDKFSYRTFARGDITVPNVYMSTLAGTTPDSLEKCLPDTAFGGGFASRIMFVYQKDTDRRNALPSVDDTDSDIRAFLIERLKQIAQLGGQFKLTAGGEKLYRDWYNSMEMPDDKRLDGYYGRKHDHVLRLAMILSVDRSFDLEVNEFMIEAAIKALDVLEEYMPGALAKVGTADHNVHIERVIRIMTRSKRISHSELLRKNYPYLNSTAFRELMETLIQSGIIARDPEKPHFYVWLGKLIADQHKEPEDGSAPA